MLKRHPFLRFCVVGGIGTVVDALVLAGLLLLLGHHPILARIPAIFIAMCATWWLNRHYTFRSEIPISFREWLHYMAVNSIGAGINFSCYVLILHFIAEPLIPASLPLIPGLPMSALFSLVVATCCSMAFNYFGMKRWIFAEPKG